MTTPTQLFTLLDACFDAQNEATALWHSQEPEADDVAPDASASPETLLALVRAQHLRNFQLWHIEDTARRRDVTPVLIRCLPRTLGKGEPWWRVPARRAHFEIAVQDDLAIDGEVPRIEP